MLIICKDMDVVLVDVQPCMDALVTHCISKIMPSVKTYGRTSFNLSKDATISFAKAKDAKSNLQPAICNHTCI